MKQGWPSPKNDMRLTFSYLVLAMMVIFALEGLPHEIPEDLLGSEPPTAPEPPALPVLITIDVLSESGYTAEGSTSEVSFALDYTNVTRVTVDVTWSDDIGDNDVLRAYLVWEGDEVASDESDTGSIGLEITDEPDGMYTGNFSVQIEAISCPGIVTPVPIDRDNGNSWELSVEAVVASQEEP
jgi:hypothetical protein